MEQKINIAISGGNGLIGSRITELLAPKYNLISLGRKEGFDVSEPSSFSKFSGLKVDFFLHLAAKADVDGCEAEKDLGERSDAWKINVGGTENVVNYCKEKNIKLIYISTDFVFDGKKSEGQFYTEQDLPNPVNFYALTKYEGEKRINSSGIENIILRIAYPYRREFTQKKDFVRAIIGRLREGLEVNAVTDHIMCPTFIDDVANAIDKLIENSASGIFHAVGNTPISPYEAALKIAEKFNFDKNLIKPSTREEYFQGKASRPFNLYLKNDKIKSLGVTMRTFEQGLEKL